MARTSLWWRAYKVGNGWIRGVNLAFMVVVIMGGGGAGGGIVVLVVMKRRG